MMQTAFVDRLEQGAIAFLALAQVGLRLGLAGDVAHHAAQDFGLALGVVQDLAARQHQVVFAVLRLDPRARFVRRAGIDRAPDVDRILRRIVRVHGRVVGADGTARGLLGSDVEQELHRRVAGDAVVLHVPAPQRQVAVAHGAVEPHARVPEGVFGLAPLAGRVRGVAEEARLARSSNGATGRRSTSAAPAS